MTDCSKNGCSNITTCEVLREIDGEHYVIDVCPQHIDNLAEDMVGKDEYGDAVINTGAGERYKSLSAGMAPTPDGEIEDGWWPVGTGEVGWDKEREEGWTNVIERHEDTGEYRTVKVYEEG